MSALLTNMHSAFKPIFIYLLFLFIITISLYGQIVNLPSENTGESIQPCYVEQYLVRYDNPGQMLAQQLQNFDIAGYSPGNYLDVIISEFQQSELRSINPDFRIVTTKSDEKARYRSRALSGYQDYSEILNEMQQLTISHPSLCQLIDLGPTWGETYSEQGYTAYDNSRHHIWAMKVSDNVNVDEDEPGFYFVGNHHAREPMTTKICMQLLNNLVSGYNVNPEITRTVNGKQIWIVPMVNPDGYQIVQDSLDVWWRKNLRDNNNNHSFDSAYTQNAVGADGVDLNRNYDFYWWSPGASSNPNDAVYRGPYADSEPEMQMLENLIMSHHFVGGISYHSYGEQVIYPWTDFNGNLAPDNNVLSSLGSDMAAAIPGQFGGTYGPFNFGIVYGAIDMWAYARKGILAYLIEAGTTFVADSLAAYQVTQDNQVAPFVLMNRFDQAMLTGLITDAVTGQPLEATVFIEGIDGLNPDRLPMTSDTTYGRYYRALLPQTYTVRISRFGYREEVRENVIISAGQPTIMNVELQPRPLVSLSGTVYNNYGEPLPEANVAIASLTNTVTSTDASGLFTLTGIPTGTHTFRITCENYGMREYFVNIGPEGNDLAFILYMPVYADGFEAENQSWSRTGMWARTAVDPHLGSFCLTDSPGVNYANNGNSYCKLNIPFDLSESDYLGASFWVNYEFTDPEDWCIFQVSTDNVNWQGVAGFNTIQSEWSRVDLDLSWFTGHPAVYIQFQMFTNASMNSSGINIDDFCLYSDTPPVFNYGDVNGDDLINSVDIDLVTAYAAGCDPLPVLDPRPWDAMRVITADVDGDDAITAFDAALIWQYIEGNINTFPVNLHGYLPPVGNLITEFDDRAFTFMLGEDSFGFDMIVYTDEVAAFGIPSCDATGAVLHHTAGDGWYRVSVTVPYGLEMARLSVPFDALIPLRENLTVYYRLNSQPGEWNADFVPSQDEHQAPLPEGISSIYPNPFNPSTRIEFSLKAKTHVSVQIYNVCGQRVKTLADEVMTPGLHSLVWNGLNESGRKVGSGIYFCKMETGPKTYTRKLILIK